ncbi:MAG: TIGR02757 family protein [Alistipes sp.]|nr:TIGR02757 family protein [Alistipes sp.]
MERLYSEMSYEEMFELLESLHDKFNNESFIEADPISVPHSYADAGDIEISGLLASTIAWGNRKAIVQSSHRMMRYMDNSPKDFVLNASDAEIATLSSYVHRTFNGEDLQDFVRALRHIFNKWGSIGGFFESRYAEHQDLRRVFSEFRREFHSVEHNPHSEKHMSSIDKGAACKRLCMYLRWMVRRDDRGVDFGLWRGIPMSALYMPLDIHTSRMGRGLGLLERKQNDWKAVEELTASLREFNAEDPVRYDYSLFGVGITHMLD